MVLALAGTTLLNLDTDAIGENAQGEKIYLRDVWPTNAEIQQAMASVTSDMFSAQYADVFTGDETVRSSAIELASEIAENAPLALMSMREQMRPGLAEAVNNVTTIESREQKWLQGTNDHKEGIKAVSEKRPGMFTGT